MNSSNVELSAEKIWNYHHINQKLEKSDCILVLGSSDIRVAEWGAKLFLEHWAPQIIFSGGKGRLTENLFTKPEAEIFTDVAIKMGVPKEKILIENKSTNTGENVTFTKNHLEKKNISHNKYIVVHKPYMERRAYATFRKIWPEKEIIVTSPHISFSNYPYEPKHNKDYVINIMVGDLQRIKLYSKKGYQIPQQIFEDVWQAYEDLVKLGYTKHLVNE
jgi:uncharacterized SAM-binding protein YcdF (DUF218 family)